MEKPQEGGRGKKEGTREEGKEELGGGGGGEKRRGWGKREEEGEGGEVGGTSESYLKEGTRELSLTAQGEFSGKPRVAGAFSTGRRIRKAVHCIQASTLPLRNHS